MHWTAAAWTGMRAFLSRLSPISWAAEKLAVLEWYHNETRGKAGGLRSHGSEHGLPTESILMTLTANEFVDYIVDRYDPDLIVEILGLSSEQIVYAFLEDVVENRHKFDLWEPEDEEPEREEN